MRRRRPHYHDIIDAGIRCRRLVVENEHRKRIVQTIGALMPDVRAAVTAASLLVNFYGKPRT